MEGTPSRLFSTLTCPECGLSSREAMPENACQWFYTCTGCNARLKPKPGDCCVFCSYGDAPCPPKAEEQCRPTAD
ncbi:MAG TPA: GDCCVxC domain-containing (seleno)protein [Armatimonadaceae bacterium]|nr:GDCCVxC domain-containing (seleno)protein [Armatimonadaceae bacterium]